MTMFWPSSAFSADGSATRIWMRLRLALDWTCGADSSNVSSGGGAPALASASDPHAMARLVSSVQESKARLDSLQTRMRRTGDASIAPLIAQQMQELDYRSSLVAKALGKVGSTIKEVATAA